MKSGIIYFYVHPAKQQTKKEAEGATSYGL